MHSRHLSFYKNTAWQYGLQVLKYLFPFILIPYLTRVLGTDGYAVYAYVLSFMTVTQTIADFGFTLSGTKKVVDIRDDKRALSSLVGNITGARILLLIGLFAATFIIALFIPIMSENISYVLLAFAAMALKALLPDFLFQGFEKMSPLTTRYFASKGVQVLLTLVLVHSISDLLLVAIADIIGSIVGLVWSFATVKKMFDVGISMPRLRLVLFELRDSAIYCVSNVSSALFSGFTTIIIGLALTDKAQLAYWSLALTTITAVQALYAPVTNSLYPHMLNNGDYRFAKKLGTLAAPVLLLGTVAYCCLSGYIAFLLGGDGYDGTAWVMRMLSPILPISFYAMFIGWPILGAMGQVKELTASSVITGIINVAFMLGIYVAGVATLEIFCLVRCVVELILLATRVFFLNRAVRQS